MRKDVVKNIVFTLHGKSKTVKTREAQLLLAAAGTTSLRGKGDAGFVLF